MTANMYITVQFTDGKIGRRRDARPLQTVIDADDPDWADTLCAEVHRHATHYLMSHDVDAALCEWTGDTPPPGTRRLEGRVFVGGIRTVAVWYLTAAPIHGTRPNQETNR